MSGSIANDFKIIGRVYNNLDTESGLYVVSITNRVTTMGTGMYISSTTSTFYKPTGELFFLIRY